MPESSFEIHCVLKKDLFGQVEMGDIASAGGRLQAVRRNWRKAPLLLRPVAALLARRERRALRRLAGLQGFPSLLEPDGRRDHLRQFLPGDSLRDRSPLPPGYFSRARGLLKSMHRRGVTHNDTHKEANWLVTPEGGPALLDFQLASCFNRRTRWFRLLALEDHRHLLKHKKRHCSGPLLWQEARLLRRKSWAARTWARTLKPVYRLFCKALGWRDREGRGYIEP